MPARVAVFDDISFKNDVSSLIKNDLIKNLNPNYNTAPTHAIPTLLNNGDYLYTHFGYIPSWAKDKKTIHVNARNESIFEKNTFRESFKNKRCIIPINGYYEWLDKVPHFIYSKNKDYLALAGIYNIYYDNLTNQNIVNIALITCEPNDKIKPIHHRMPVILEKKDYSTWLNNNNINTLNNLFKIYPSKEMTYHTVCVNVNKVSFNDKSCIKEFNQININPIIQNSLF